MTICSAEQLNYEIDLWGRVRSAVAAGSAADPGARRPISSRCAWRCTRELALDYIALRGQDAQRTLLEQAVEAYGRALDMTTTRFQGGISSALDVAQAQTQLETARASSDRCDRPARVAGACHRGLDRSGCIGLLDRTGAPRTQAAECSGRDAGDAARAPAGRGGGRAHMAAFNAQIGVARAAFFPRISLSALAGLRAPRPRVCSVPRTVTGRSGRRAC